MALERRLHALDLGPSLLELARLLEQRVALGGQDLVDALIPATADIPNELPQELGIFDFAGGPLADFGGSSLDSQAGYGGFIAGLDRSLERLFLGFHHLCKIRHALAR